MTKVLIVYHSMYGHIETMANAVAEGARSVAGVEVTVLGEEGTPPERLRLLTAVNRMPAAPARA